MITYSKISHFWGYSFGVNSFWLFCAAHLTVLHVTALDSCVSSKAFNVQTKRSSVFPPSQNSEHYFYLSNRSACLYPRYSYWHYENVCPWAFNPPASLLIFGAAILVMRTLHCQKYHSPTQAVEFRRSNHSCYAAVLTSKCLWAITNNCSLES